MQRKARVTTEGGDLSARQIVLDRASGRVSAGGDVTGFLIRDPDPAEQSGPAGMFSDQQPVFLAAGELVSDPESQTWEYRNGARLWQGRNRVDADSIVIDQGRG